MLQDQSRKITRVREGQNSGFTESFKNNKAALIWQSLLESQLSGLLIGPSHDGAAHATNPLLLQHCAFFMRPHALLISKGLLMSFTLSFRPGPECASFVPLFKTEIKIFRVFLRTARCCFLEIEFRPWGRSKETSSAPAFSIAWYLCLMERVPENDRGMVSLFIV